MTEIQSVYFLEPGSNNTEKTFEVAKRRAEELGIKTIVVASTSGETGLKAVEAFPNYKVVVVTHTTGFRAPDVQELTPQNRAKILEEGGLILTAAHAFGGVGRAVRRKLNTTQVDEIMAYTLRVFGQGTKVACEIALMAADAGLIRTDEEVISIGGTARGADTALVVKPANTHDFFELRVKEVLCKPRL
ncbi:MAG: pyruvate kinase alpha/beta domain-containing protein [Dehalococcoidia bacterium]